MTEEWKQLSSELVRCKYKLQNEHKNILLFVCPQYTIYSCQLSYFFYITIILGNIFSILVSCYTILSRSSMPKLDWSVR